ncbi:MAG: hypothetical protein HYY35_10500 [Deltaproteobacteria bacterium]|nr:hypothetical protein [Deltaproteobacteria bacterium]
MKTSIRALCFALCIPLLGSCATSEQTQQLLGGLTGAGLGAGIGALATGGDTKAVLAGAAAGAVVGWGVVKLSQYHAERTRSVAEEAKAYGYRESEGTVVKLRSARVQPETLRSGERATFDMNYAVLAPPSAGQVAVTERWDLSKDGKSLSEMPAQRVRREPGGWRSKASIDIPKGAEAGTYVVKSRVEAGSSYDERISTFLVR